MTANYTKKGIVTSHNAFASLAYGYGINLSIPNTLVTMFHHPLGAINTSILLSAFAAAQKAYDKVGLPTIGPNQILTIEGQLEVGARGFMIDLWPDDSKSSKMIMRHGEPFMSTWYSGHYGDMLKAALQKIGDSSIIVTHGDRTDVPEVEDLFKIFTDFLEKSRGESTCETITVPLESGIPNDILLKNLYRAYDSKYSKPLKDYIFSVDPTVRDYEPSKAFDGGDLCYKIVILAHTNSLSNKVELNTGNKCTAVIKGTSYNNFNCVQDSELGGIQYYCNTHKNSTKYCVGTVQGIMELETYKENHFSYDDICNVRESRAAYSSATPMFLFNSFQAFFKSKENLESIANRLKDCGKNDQLKGDFFATMVAVDYISSSKDGVFLCYDWKYTAVHDSASIKNLWNLFNGSGSYTVSNPPVIQENHKVASCAAGLGLKTEYVKELQEDNGGKFFSPTGDFFDDNM